MTHYNFFSPVAEETKVILNSASDEAPDIIVPLHSHETAPCILPTTVYQPFFKKERVTALTDRLNEHYKKMRLPYITGGWKAKIIANEDEKFSPRSSFNLICALHHISGSMVFTFECCHGIIEDNIEMVHIDYDTTLDVQLNLYQGMFSYILGNRLYWE